MAPSCSNATAVPSSHPALGGRFDHGVLTAHVIGGERRSYRLAHGGNDVEVAERRFHHHDVSALGQVQLYLTQRLPQVAGVQLVAAPVAAAGDGDIDRFRNGPYSAEANLAA